LRAQKEGDLSSEKRADHRPFHCIEVTDFKGCRKCHERPQWSREQVLLTQFDLSTDLSISVASKAW